MNIAVITGGLSTERDVAISSGGKIAKALRSKGHNVVFVDVFFGYEGDKTPEELFRENGDLVESKSVAENIPDLRRSRLCARATARASSAETWLRFAAMRI